MLTSYLHRQAGQRFAWGRSDCATFIADWVALLTGIDAAAHVRGTYTDAGSAELHFARFGGLARAVGSAMRRAGFRMTQTPIAGDVAVVRFGPILACAIWTGARWVYRGDRGLVLSSHGRAVAIWRI